MEEFSNLLWHNIEIVQCICNKIENQEAYIEDIRGYLPSLNQMITSIFTNMQQGQISLELNQGFIIQALNDILYGIENEDSVFLLDVLRYGLLEIYGYISSELQKKSGGVKCEISYMGGSYRRGKT